MDRDPLIGVVLGERYKIVSVLGEGGMATVYRAEHVLIGKEFAVKVLAGDVAADSKMVERFKREAQAASRLDHEHIIQVTDFGSTPEGLLYIAMELLQGRDLATAIHREAPFEPGRAIRIARQIALGLAHAHDRGLVHRDLKPENIMLVPRDEHPDFVKILDFGLARVRESAARPEGERLTSSGMVFGTPEYMCPEQALGKEVDARGDLYAVGVVLYQMLTKRLPFLGDTAVAYITQHVSAKPPPLKVANPKVRASAAVEALVMKLLAKEPVDRPQSGRDLVAALRSVLKEGARQVDKYELGLASTPLPGQLTTAHIDQARSHIGMSALARDGGVGNALLGSRPLPPRRSPSSGVSQNAVEQSMEASGERQVSSSGERVEQSGEMGDLTRPDYFQLPPDPVNESINDAEFRRLKMEGYRGDLASTEVERTISDGNSPKVIVKQQGSGGRLLLIAGGMILLALAVAVGALLQKHHGNRNALGDGGMPGHHADGAASEKGSADGKAAAADKAGAHATTHADGGAAAAHADGAAAKPAAGDKPAGSKFAADKAAASDAGAAKPQADHKPEGNGHKP
jgi:serine/threonine protein kinase